MLALQPSRKHALPAQTRWLHHCATSSEQAGCPGEVAVGGPIGGKGPPPPAFYQGGKPVVRENHRWDLRGGIPLSRH